MAMKRILKMSVVLTVIAGASRPPGHWEDRPTPLRGVHRKESWQFGPGPFVRVIPAHVRFRSLPASNSCSAMPGPLRAHECDVLKGATEFAH